MHVTLHLHQTTTQVNNHSLKRNRQIQDQGCKTALESTVDTSKSSDQQSLNMARCMVDISQAKLNIPLWYGLEQLLALWYPQPQLAAHANRLQIYLTCYRWPTGSYGHLWRPTNLKQMSLWPFIQGSIHLVRQKAEEGNISQRE